MMFMPSGVAAAAGLGYEFSMIAGSTGGNTGFVRTSIGSINPDQDIFTGFPGVQWQLDALFTNTTSFFVNGAVGTGITDTDTYWRYMTIKGTFVGGAKTLTFLRANRSTFANAQWVFTPEPDQIVNGNSYDVVWFR